VEKQKERLRVLSEDEGLHKAFSRYLEKVVPQEGGRDGMTPPAKNLRFLWRPNNYRLKIPFRGGFDGKQEIKGGVPFLGGSFPVERDGRSGVVTVRVRSGLVLQVCRSCVVAIYSLRGLDGRKVWWEVEVDGVRGMDEWVDGKVAGILGECLVAVRGLGLELDFGGAVWIRHEDSVKGEEFLDGLDPGLVLHDTYCKKVYEKEVEFSSPFYMKNFIANRSIERVAPEVARELQELRFLVECGIDRVALLKARIGCLGDVFRFGDEIRGLSLEEREVLSDWLFCFSK